MASRLDLQTKLEELLGSRNVYYQPPSSMMIQYDAIVYSRINIENSFANDSVYKQVNAYKVTAICKKPDSEIVGKLSKLPMCKFNTYFTSDGLNHYVFTLYF